jgi:phosphatidylinositol alpha-1,6-mannosyltransferase
VQLASLQPRGHTPPSLGRKIAFGGPLILDQLRSRVHSILFSHLGLAGVERLVPSRLQAPYGVFLHGIEAWKPLTAGQTTTVNRARLRAANSQYTARRVREANPAVCDVAVCPLALLPENGPDKPGPQPTRSETPTVLIVGRMAGGEGYKGHDELIDAWPHVTNLVPDARLVIAGGGDDAVRLRAKAEQAASGRGIVFTGFVDRSALDRLYEDAWVFAMPSRGEGFGLVYLEAMARRLPCIGSIHDAAGEVIDHGRTGLLVDLRDGEALGRAIVALLKDAPLRAGMGEAGWAKVQKEFTFDRFSRTMAALLDERFEGDA